MGHDYLYRWQSSLNRSWAVISFGRNGIVHVSSLYASQFWKPCKFPSLTNCSVIWKIKHPCRKLICLKPIPGLNYLQPRLKKKKINPTHLLKFFIRHRTVTGICPWMCWGISAGSYTCHLQGFFQRYLFITSFHWNQKVNIPVWFVPVRPVM